jgi:hypothetical protein
MDTKQSLNQLGVAKQSGRRPDLFIQSFWLGRTKVFGSVF